MPRRVLSKNVARRTLRSINLNHLVALDALLAEGSVTRAAKVVGVSQSALSHTLSALRDAFEDPLLIRGREGMVLSERAADLSGPLRRTLLELEALLQGPDTFDPGTTDREFRLSTADFIGARIARAVVPRFAREAPHARLTIRPFSPQSTALDLERGDIDAVVGPPLADMASVVSTPWAAEPFACIVRGEHPCANQPFDLEAFAGLDHIMVSPRGTGTGWVDHALAERGMTRKVVVRAASFLAAPLIVADSDLVLTAPQSVVDPFVEAFGLCRLPVPVELTPLPLVLSWHRRATNDSAQRWFRALVALS